MLTPQQIKEIEEKFKEQVKVWNNEELPAGMDEESDDVTTYIQGKMLNDFIIPTINNILAERDRKIWSGIKELDDNVAPSNFEEDNFDAGKHEAFTEAMNLLNLLNIK
jgi:hypothetical protein